MKKMLCVLLLSAGCGGSSAPEEARPATPTGTPADVTMNAEQISHGAVKWAAVTETPVADFVELPGRLVADDDHTARVSPSVRGRVTDVRANVGDSVALHQVLVTLQSEEASARRAELVKATAELTERQATLNFARLARERAERLLALKAGSAQDVERARADEAAAQAALTQAEAGVAHARTALSVLEVSSTSGLLELAAPIAGVVIARDVVVGSVIEAGASALAVTDPTHLWLEFGAPDDVSSRLQPGQRIQFTTPAADGWLDARVLRLNGALDATTRLVTVRASVENNSKKLRPEMFVTARVNRTAPKPGITVPHDAVQLIEGRPVVFVVEPDTAGGAKFIRRDVETGTTAAGRTHIVTGLKPGDIVVSDGAFAVKSMFSRAKMPAGG